MAQIVVTLADIQTAARRIAPHVLRTPVTQVPTLGTQFQGQVWLKWESHQHTGSFKLRGALNRLLADPGPRGTEVIAASAGNHGQGVAVAARLCGRRAVVYVPEDAAQTKISAMRDLGATVHLVPGGYGDAEVAALAAVRRAGATWVSPYNDPLVIAGQGTVGLEFLEQVPDLDAVLVPAGGGGLLSGVGLALKALKPEIDVVGVGVEASPFLHVLYGGGDVGTVVERSTLAEGLAGPVEEGSITIDLTRQICDDFILVTEEEVAAAIAYAYRTLGEVVEGAGAVGLAALLATQYHPTGQSTGVIISGGNIDTADLDRILRNRSVQVQSRDHRSAKGCRGHTPATPAIRGHSGAAGRR